MAYTYTPNGSGGTGLAQIDETKPLGSEDPAILDDVIRQTRAAFKDVLLKNHDNNGNIDLSKLAAGTGGFVPTGVPLPWFSASPPTGFLLCDGSAVSRTTYARLFAVWGTIHGAGDGSTTFNLWNATALMLVGAGARGGYTTRTLLNVYGAETATLGLSNLPPININEPATGRQFGPSYWDAGGAYLSGPSGRNVGGSSAPVGIMPPCQAVNWIVRGE